MLDWFHSPYNPTFGQWVRDVVLIFVAAWVFWAVIGLPTDKEDDDE